MSWFDIATLAGRLKHKADIKPHTFKGGLDAAYDGLNCVHCGDDVRAEHHRKRHEFLPTLWADDTINTMGFMKAISWQLRHSRESVLIMLCHTKRASFGLLASNFSLVSIVPRAHCSNSLTA